MDCSSQCHKKNLDTRRNHPSSFFLPFFFQVMLGMRALAVCLLVATCSVEKQLAIDMCQIRRDCGYTVYLGGLLPLTLINTIRKKSLQKLTCYWAIVTVRRPSASPENPSLLITHHRNFWFTCEKRIFPFPKPVPFHLQLQETEAILLGFSRWVAIQDGFWMRLPSDRSG